MTKHERICFNDALGRAKAYDWRDRTVERLRRKLEPLNPHDKIIFLRKLDHFIETGKVMPEQYDRSALDAADLASLEA